MLTQVRAYRSKCGHERLRLITIAYHHASPPTHLQSFSTHRPLRPRQLPVPRTFPAAAAAEIRCRTWQSPGGARDVPRDYRRAPPNEWRAAAAAAFFTGNWKIRPPLGGGGGGSGGGGSAAWHAISEVCSRCVMGSELSPPTPSNSPSQRYPGWYIQHRAAAAITTANWRAIGTNV